MPERLPPFAILGMVIVTIVVTSCYTITPYIGAAILSIVDGALFGLRWFGFRNPVACAAAIGLIIGGLTGLALALAKSGKPTLRMPIAIGVAIGLVCLGLGGLVYRETMKPAVTAVPAPGPAPVTTPAN